MNGEPIPFFKNMFEIDGRWTADVGDGFHADDVLVVGRGFESVGRGTGDGQIGLGVDGYFWGGS